MPYLGSKHSGDHLTTKQNDFCSTYIFPYCTEKIIQYSVFGTINSRF